MPRGQYTGFEGAFAPSGAALFPAHNQPFLLHDAAPLQQDLYPHSVLRSFNINMYFDNFKPSQLENSAKVLLRSTAGT